MAVGRARVDAEDGNVYVIKQVKILVMKRREQEVRRGPPTRNRQRRMTLATTERPSGYDGTAGDHTA